jgi:hypothetical protein
MPSSQSVLKAKIAELEAEQRATKAESLVLRMELDSREAVISYQNGAMEEMGKLIDEMGGGLVANLKIILARHGVTFRRERAAMS